MRAGVKSVAAVVLAASLASPALAQETIKMGALATLEGAFAVLGEDSLRGVRMAMEEFDHKAGGKKIELVTVPTDASPARAVRATRKPDRKPDGKGKSGQC